MSLGKVRCDGLGWGFALAFTVHVAAPGVAATVCAYQFGGEWRWALVPASVLAYVPLVWLVRSAFEKRRRIEALDVLATTGWQSMATVLSVERLLGNSKSNGQRFGRARLVMRVAPPGRAPWDVENVAWYSMSELKALGQGSIVDLSLSHADVREVVVLRVHPPAYAATAPQVGFVGMF
jgi:hypothetical protein